MLRVVEPAGVASGKSPDDPAGRRGQGRIDHAMHAIAKRLHADAQPEHLASTDPNDQGSVGRPSERLMTAIGRPPSA
ncbi:MAG: hypothetical protein AAFN74_18185, partial [Myxococcota bacterium]